MDRNPSSARERIGTRAVPGNGSEPEQCREWIGTRAVPGTDRNPSSAREWLDSARPGPARLGSALRDSGIHRGIAELANPEPQAPSGAGGSCRV
ncbi:hypothetical protein TURU_153193 [Turdus rufiventris]|nr:hypothetical protein TURU_153193 [Turdus rufiventris]